jgi:molybdopterin-guanine dinucleotide biosynthesis protein A
MKPKITGMVLAGGQGRRMGGVDKGLVELAGRPFIAHVLERLAPQVDALLINANQNRDRYAVFGYPVIQDDIPGFAGPLAGLQRGLRAMDTPLLVTVPCDSPFLPVDLVDRLYQAMEQADAQLAVARTFDRTHPVFSLVRKDVLDSLIRYLQEGGRKIDAWYAALRVVEVPFYDEADAFMNINTAAELSAVAQNSGSR